MKRLMLFLATFALLLSATPTLCAQPDDALAMSGLKEAKAIYDVAVGEPQKLLLYLQVIGQAHESVKAQGIEPDFIISFISGSVLLVSNDHAKQQENPELWQKLSQELTKLKGMGMRLEACAVATELFGIKQEQLMPGVELIGNSFVSFIGYQSKGYAMIPIM